MQRFIRIVSLLSVLVLGGAALVSVTGCPGEGTSGEGEGEGGQ
jgi:hypothetical protein